VLVTNDNWILKLLKKSFPDIEGRVQYGARQILPNSNINRFSENLIASLHPIDLTLIKNFKRQA
jgi:hypothetical protein